jgi:hypothetical protein
MSCVKRFDDWWRSAHALACVWFFVNKSILIVSEIIGPVSDIATVVVYFRTGNHVWGILSAVFVGLGWFWQMLFTGIMGSGSAEAPISSERFKRACSRPLGCFCGCLHLGTSMMHLDDCCAGLERHREGGPEHVRSTPLNAEKHTSTKLLVTIFKYAPNLMLHAYVLLVNQLSPKYATHRVTGWGLAAQLVSTLFSAYSVSTGLSSGAFEIIQDKWAASKAVAFTAVVFLDTVCSVLRVMLFAAAFHAWVALALGCWVIINFVLGAYFDEVLAGFAIVFTGAVSPCFPFTRCNLRIPKSGRVLGCFWESAIVTGVFVSLPFLLAPRGTVFEHGLCSSLAELTSTGNCIPRAVLYSIVSWLAVNAVSSSTVE